MKKIYLLMFLSCLLTVSCDNFEDDINVNPNLPSQASGTQLIANSMFYLPGLSSSPQGEFMAQYLAETQYVGLSLYPQQSTSFYGLYQGPLANLQAVLDAEELNGNEGPVENQIAMAKILKSYFFWNITDRWGDVPYFDALQGTENFTPKYDSQEAIYTDLFLQLTDASQAIVPGSVSNDIMYGGDMVKWQKLANSVRMLMALRLSEVDPVKGSEEFNKAMNEGVMDSNNDNFVFRHRANADNQNYWYSQIVDRNREWWALTEGLVAEMLPVNDPRLPVYGNPTRDTGEFIGLKFGEEVNIGTDQYSLLGDAIYAQDAPVQLVTYSQVLFAMAEAVELGWISGDAELYYNAAVENSVLQWTGSTDGAAELLLQPGIAFEPANAIRQIATQRWVHLFMFGYEAWSEWRRTGYPDNLVAPNGAEVPTRLSYPDNEAFLNETNYNDAVQSQFGGEESIYGKIWWDN